MSDPVLVLVALQKRFLALRRRGPGRSRSRPVIALDQLSLEVGPGRIVGMLGPNGAGKTTALRVALGLVRPDAGDCRVAGTPIRGGLGDAVTEVAGIVDTPRFDGRLTARQTLTLLARIHRIGASRVADCLESVGLAGQADRRVAGFSTGMRQRLALATALLRRPRLLLLDEPANGLDPAGMHRLHEVLRRLADDGSSVLLSSHALAEVQRLADEVVIVSRGRRIAGGTIEQVLRPPVATYRLGVEGGATAAAGVLAGSFALRPGPDDTLLVTTDRPVADLSRLVTGAGCTITELTPLVPSLDERYLDLVGAHEGGAEASWGT